MGAERLDAQGIRTATQLFKGLYDSGLPGKIASDLYSHEKAHADADEESRGEFGYQITTGWVVAYYLVEGDRTPEQLLKIASAPGFSSMSSQDWNVYNRAWRDWMNKVREEKYKKIEARNELREMLIEKLAQRLDELSHVERFPRIENLLRYEFKDLIITHGQLLYEVYQEAINEVRNLSPFAKYAGRKPADEAQNISLRRDFSP